MIASAALFLALAVAGDAPVAAPDSVPAALVTESVAPERGDGRWSTVDWVVLGVLPVAVAGAAFADDPVRAFAQDNRSAPTRGLALVGDGLGDGRIVLPVVGLVAWGSWSGRAPRLARASVNALEAWTLTQIVAQTGKYTLGRARPGMEEGNASFHGIRLTGDQYHSLPSGHTSTAWGILPAYAMEFEDRPWVAGGLYAAATLTGLARVHEDRHWLSDVVAAAGIGWLSNRAVRSWNQDGPRPSAVAATALPLPGGWVARVSGDF